MDRVQAQVLEFHSYYNVPIEPKPVIPSFERLALRKKLIDEEFSELKSAMAARDLVEMADAVGDLLYVVYGTAVELGLDMAPIMDEIHRSNMSKLGADGRPVYDEHGKVLKGPHFSSPDIASIIKDQQK